MTTYYGKFHKGDKVRISWAPHTYWHNRMAVVTDVYNAYGKPHATVRLLAGTNEGTLGGFETEHLTLVPKFNVGEKVKFVSSGSLTNGEVRKVDTENAGGIMYSVKWPSRSSCAVYLGYELEAYVAPKPQFKVGNKVKFSSGKVGIITRIAPPLYYVQKGNGDVRAFYGSSDFTLMFDGFAIGDKVTGINSQWMEGVGTVVRYDKGEYVTRDESGREYGWNGDGLKLYKPPVVKEEEPFCFPTESNEYRRESKKDDWEIRVKLKLDIEELDKVSLLGVAKWLNAKGIPFGIIHNDLWVFSCYDVTTKTYSFEEARLSGGTRWKNCKQMRQQYERETGNSASGY